MSDKLSHLSEQEIEELINKYYAKHPVKDLIKEYNIPIKHTNLVTYFPPEKLDLTCKFCNSPMFRKRISKSESYSYTNYKTTCQSCGHIEKDSCTCSGCIEELQKQYKIEIDRRKQIIRRALKLRNSKSVDLKELTSVEKIYLGALISEGIDAEFKVIHPVIHFPNLFAPTVILERKILQLLESKRAISMIVDPEDPNIEFTDDEIIINSRTASWYLNVFDEEKSREEIVKSLLSPIHSYALNDCLEVWKEISKHECLCYLDDTVQKVFKIKYNISATTIMNLNSLVEHFSAGQIFKMISGATNFATRIKVEKDLSRDHAANMIMKSVTSYAQTALKENYDMKPFRRTKEVRQSIVSKFLFQNIMKSFKDGFDKVPQNYYKEHESCDPNESFID